MPAYLKVEAYGGDGKGVGVSCQHRPSASCLALDSQQPGLHSKQRGGTAKQLGVTLLVLHLGNGMRQVACLATRI